MVLRRTNPTAVQAVHDGCIVGRGLRVGFERKMPSHLHWYAFLVSKGVQHVTVPSRINDNHDVAVVLGRSTHERRTTDVNHLEQGGIVERRVVRCCRSKGVQVDRDNLDWSVAKGVKLACIVLTLKARQQRTMHRRMKRFHPAVENFRVARDLAHVKDVQSCLSQGACRSAGGQQFEAQRGQALAEFNDA